VSQSRDCPRNGGRGCPRFDIHGELADLALQRRDPGLVIRNDGCLRLLSAELTAIILGQPELKQIGRQIVVPGRIAAPDGAGTGLVMT